MSAADGTTSNKPSDVMMKTSLESHLAPTINHDACLSRCSSCVWAFERDRSQKITDEMFTDFMIQKLNCIREICYHFRPDGIELTLFTLRLLGANRSATTLATVLSWNFRSSLKNGNMEMLHAICIKLLCRVDLCVNIVRDQLCNGSRDRSSGQVKGKPMHYE